MGIEHTMQSAGKAVESRSLTLETTDNVHGPDQFVWYALKITESRIIFFLRPFLQHPAGLLVDEAREFDRTAPGQGPEGGLADGLATSCDN